MPGRVIGLLHIYARRILKHGLAYWKMILYSGHVFAGKVLITAPQGEGEGLAALKYIATVFPAGQ
jgi:hypothetical protein